MLSISSRYRKLRSGSMRAMVVSLALRFSRVLEDAEHDEFRWPHRRNPDLADQPSVQDVVARHRGFVARDEERLLLGASEQRAQTPLAAQEDPERVDHTRPQAWIVGLEHDPLRAFVDRALEEDEQTSHGDVLP